MSNSATVERITLWDQSSLDERARLSKAVYPPDETADWAGRHIDWSDPEWGMAVRDEEDRLVSYASLHLRDATRDGTAVVVGGVGGVMTHPDHRGKGHARLAMQTAKSFFAANEADFGLLVCEERLVPYYQRLGWARFEGELLTRQRGETVPFTFNLVMVTDVGQTAPRDGVIDLAGPPW